MNPSLNLIDTEPHQLRVQLDGVKKDLSVQAKLAGYNNGKFPPPKKSPKISFKMANRWKLPSVKTAVKFGLKAGKTNIYTVAGTFALGYVLDKTGWFDDDGELTYYDDETLPHIEHLYRNYRSGSSLYDTADSACAHDEYCIKAGGSAFAKDGRLAEDGVIRGLCYTSSSSAACGNWASTALCPEGTKFSPRGCIFENAQKKPVTDAMIDDLDLSDYEPHQTDIPFLSPYLGTPDETVITAQPKPIVLPTETTTTQNPDGSTTTTATDTTVNVTINTTNQGDMYVTTTETTTTTTYQDGTQISKTTETKTTLGFN